MTERSTESQIKHLSEEIERFDGKKASEKPQENLGVVGSDAAMRMGLELVFSVLILGAAGYFLDSWLGTAPFLMVVGLFVGFAVGLWALFRTSNPPKT